MKKKKQKPQREAGKPAISLRAQSAAEEAYQLIEDGKLEEAIELLLPLAGRYSRDSDLLYQLGYAYVQRGDLWQGVTWLQKTVDLGWGVELWAQLGFLYLSLGLKMLALHALRQSVRQKPVGSEVILAQQAIESIESDFQQIAKQLNLPPDALEKGFRYLEEGQIELQNGNFPNCIYLNRSAIKYLGAFPPPRNNLSLALFFHGQWEEAIQTTRQVLGFDDTNIQALANIVRFLSWTGQEDVAKVYWERLKQITPPNDDLRLKMSEAAAVVNDDQAVYDLLRQVNKNQLDRSGLAELAQRRLAIAEANLRLPTARKKLGQLEDTSKLASDILEALKKGERGLGWSPRFPYFIDSEYLPQKEFEKMLDLMQREDEAPSKRSRKEIDQFAARFPQIVLVAKKIILEHQQAEAGIQLLVRIGTPAAYIALREFGLSQSGSDEDRTKALFELVDAGQIQPNETLRIWQKGEWRDIQLKRYEITNEDEERKYSQKVADLINAGQEAHQNHNVPKAEKLFLRAIQIEPNAKEAYNNLGAIYAGREDHQQAKAMFQKAIDVDPLYVIPRCNLATYLLDDEAVDEAETMIAPLVDVSRLTPQMMAFLSYIRARIAVMKNEFEEARNQLEIAMEINPNYRPAQELLARVKMIIGTKAGFEVYRKRQEIRNHAARVQLQKQLSTTDPSLGETFSNYTKEAMTGMARELAPSGGWSAFKKARLAQFLIGRLVDFDILKWLVTRLLDDERKALVMILDQGGYLLWPIFVDAFGHDLEESPYWQYHQPETTMGRLRFRGLLVEATVNGELYVAIPTELREPLRELLNDLP